jgi:hypothetical protein
LADFIFLWPRPLVFARLVETHYLWLTPISSGNGSELMRRAPDMTPETRSRLSIPPRFFLGRITLRCKDKVTDNSFYAEVWRHNLLPAGT